ncbi:hypothetical protein [Alishewanella sp. SMS8]|uniref:hypothetical protein n=1 Tax=Alishewanella sp. SMS8 TaxID=2994676 RepID=UPI002741B44C|nr:hypothetical protein [Alishewanella sp. SMS8]MDP5035040.1 hypothetical protein [Alishewanella sp.]MDP5458224.1 hypothetical protein [Alishewanella sp. SMS8]
MKVPYLLRTLLFVIILFNGNSAADELYLTIEEREQQAVLIVSAKVVSLVPLKFSEDLYERKVAILAIQNISKGNSNAEFILVSVGYYWPYGMLNSQDINVEVGMKGTWFLTKEKETGLFKLNSPSDVVINPLN